MKTRFDPTGQLIMLRVRIVGPRRSVVARVALDTGATATLIGEKLLKEAGYSTDGMRTIEMITGSGVEMAPIVCVQKIHALGCQRSNLQVIAHSLPTTSEIDGLLGIDFLRNRVVTIDFRRGLINLTTQ